MGIKKITGYVTCAFILSLCPLIKAQAQCNTVNISYSENWYPLTYNKSDGTTDGIAIRIHNEVFKAIKTPINFQGNIPWKRQLSMLEHGGLDAIATINFSPTRNQTYLLTDAIHSFNVRLFTRKKAPITYTSVAGLNKYIGAYSRGSYFGPEFEKLKKTDKTTVLPVNGTETIIEMLLNGRVDYIVLPEILGTNLIKQKKLENLLSVSGPVLHKQTVHLAFSRKSPCAHLVQAYNQALQNLKTSGFVKDVHDMY